MKTTTKGVVVDEEKIQKVKKALAHCYSGMPDTVIAHLIEKKGIEHVLSIADQTAYQLDHKSQIPENPTGHFVALTLHGMNTPPGYRSPEKKAQDEKERIISALNRRKKSEQDRKERIPREHVKEFLKNFEGGNNDGAEQSL